MKTKVFAKKPLQLSLGLLKPDAPLFTPKHGMVNGVKRHKDGRFAKGNRRIGIHWQGPETPEELGITHKAEQTEQGRS